MVEPGIFVNNQEDFPLPEGSQEEKTLQLSTQTPQNQPEAPDSQSIYFQTLKDLRFDTWDLKNGMFTGSEGSIDEMQSSSARYNREMQIFSKNLPCEANSAIYVRMDSQRMDMMRALISGTEDTPYAHGLYLFDIVCPGSYPQNPPVVKIVTTGGGEVRFNPNLYSDGFVCLSVINTWEGDASQRWNPAHSTILQVLLSIQVLVMDDLVIQKEPDFEDYQKESNENIIYSNIVKLNNIKYAMVDMLQNPPEEFEQVVKKHFELKKDEIIETVCKWLEQAKQEEGTVNYNSVDYLVSDHNHHTLNLIKQSSFVALMEEQCKILFELLNYEKPEEEIGKQMVLVKEVDFHHSAGFLHSLSYVVSGDQINEFVMKEFQKIEKLVFPQQKVWICHQIGRKDLLQLIIEGKESSDYAYGFFLFDIAIPYQYPQIPPSVVLKTTGFNTVQFSEFISKKGLITVTDLPNYTHPYSLQNLITFLAEIFTKTYNSPILRYATMQYAIQQTKSNPPYFFREQVNQHFDQNMNQIQQKLNQWISQIQQPQQIFQNSSLINLFSQVDPIALFQQFIFYSPSPALNCLQESAQILQKLPLLVQASANDPVAPDSTSVYFQTLSHKRLTLQLFTSEAHSLYDQSNSESLQSQTPRFNKQMTTLQKHLPCEAESAVFVVMGEQRMDLMQAMISGPVDSPYAYGLFLFDIKCPQSYPQSPPQVCIKTTGGGQARFNPNLYADGFVCLSVINTWSGSPEQMWNPSYSNILQVLLSIQSLVMDKEVIQKEPGYQYAGVDSEQNVQYSTVVKYMNLKYAILENIKNPPLCFREVVQTHFQMCKEFILKNAEEWLEEASKLGQFEDLDSLVEDHNSDTLCLFRDQGLEAAFSEVVTELRDVLSSLQLNGYLQQCQKENNFFEIFYD